MFKLVLFSLLFGLSVQQNGIFVDVIFQTECGDEIVLEFVELLNELVGCQRCSALFELNDCGEQLSDVNIRVTDRGLDDIQDLQILYNTLIYAPQCIIQELELEGMVEFGEITTDSEDISEATTTLLPVCDNFLLEDIQLLAAPMNEAAF